VIFLEWDFAIGDKFLLLVSHNPIQNKQKMKRMRNGKIKLQVSSEVSEVQENSKKNPNRWWR
jgi:hypothetical protein